MATVCELNEQGKVLYSVGKYSEAMARFSEAASLDPSYQETYENMGVCYIMMGANEKAETALKTVLKLNKKHTAALFQLGNLALLADRIAEAKAYFSKAELCGFSSPEMCLNLATYYEEHGDYDNAEQQLSKAIRMSPYDIKLLGRKAQMQLRAGRFEGALQTSKEMVKTDIDNFDGHHFLYVSLIMLQRLDEAETYIADMRKRFPDSDPLVFDQIRLYDMTGQTSKALSLLEDRFPDVQTNDSLALMKLGLLLQLERVLEAVALVESTEVLQKDGRALVMVISVCLEKHDYEKALLYAEKLLTLGEEVPEYYAGLYLKPLAMKHAGKAGLAENAFRHSAELLAAYSVKVPQQLDISLYRALCELQLGNLHEARRLIDYLMAVQKDVAPFHLVASLICKAEGKTVDAQRHREIARQLAPAMPEPML